MNETYAKQYDGITDFALYLFGEGTNHQAYEMLGAHPHCKDGVAGYRFAVWAPNAASISVTGAFNDWDTVLNPMEQIGSTGVWYAFVPGVAEGCMYKYAITDRAGNLHYKADPYAFYAELRPGTASVTADLSKYKWRDKKWQKKKEKQAPTTCPC